MKRLLVLALAVTGVLAAGCFVRFGTFDRDTNHFVGLATNLSVVDVVGASVQVDFLNSSGQVVDTKNVSPCTRTLQKGMDSPIEATARSSVNARSVKTTVHPLTFGHKSVMDADVNKRNIKIAVSSDEKDVNITGTIDADEDLTKVHVCAALFDSDGNVIAVGAQTGVGTIDHGSSKDFDVDIDTSSIDVDDIDQYELWFDGLHKSDIRAPVVVGPNDFKISPTPTPTNTATPTPTATPSPPPDK